VRRGAARRLGAFLGVVIILLVLVGCFGAAGYFGFHALDREPDDDKRKRGSVWEMTNPGPHKGSVEPPLKQPKPFAAHMV